MTTNATTTGTGNGRAQQPVLETEGLTKQFGGLTAVDSVDLSIQPGELRCIIGPNGAGKSTFLKLVTGQHTPTEGTIRYDGEDVTNWEPHKRIQRGMSMKFQVPGIYADLTVEDNVRVAVQRAVRKEDQERRISEVLRRFNLESQRDALAGNLPHGKKQWLEIGMATALDSDLLLLDEPTAGMSVEERNETARFVKSLNREEDLTLVVIEHDMDFVRQIAESVTVLNQGQVFMEGTMDAVEANEDVRDIYLGREE